LEDPGNKVGALIGRGTLINTQGGALIRKRAVVNKTAFTREHLFERQQKLEGEQMLIKVKS